ncbi:hypothetical protein [Sphingomonas sp. Leaf22]|uniref:hypothetical protein n=1 Tax=Sphingomonas sp. Leaf22 TaxID=1735687 RepID=UPI000A8E0EB9|nr:hypothetical protein [Sphingomonas sp. Leaf22]
MIRARPPVWLSCSSRFATLRPGMALGIALLALALLASSWFLPAEDAARDAPLGVDVYASVVDGLRSGGDYYAVAAQELRADRAPLHPFPAIRLPTLSVVQAALPDFVSILLLIAIAAATGLAWSRRIGGWFERGPPRIAALFLLAGGMVAFVQPSLVAFHELWAGLLIAWSLAIRREDRWVEAVALALCAMVIRETAALYALAMLAAALRDGRRREALGWVAALLVFVAVLLLHARAVALVAGPLDAVSPGWGRLHGPGLFASGMARSTALIILPWWLGAPLAMLAMLGWAAAPGPLGRRAALTFGGYALAIAVFARTDNFYWALAAAPAYLVGMAFLPDAVRDLARPILDRRRVRVQRITR